MSSAKSERLRIANARILLAIRSVSMRTPDRSQFEILLNDAHATFRTVDEGRVADYIPELGNADPSHFGISVMSVDGRCVEVGDCDVEFTIQSISKPFV